MIGKLEIAGTVVLTPQLKVRIGGDLNYRAWQPSG
jgi:hypothetical protein